MKGSALSLGGYVVRGSRRMSDLDLCYLSATEQAALIRNKKLSPVELVDNALSRIEAVNPKINAFCFVYSDEARVLAQQAEQATE